MLKEPLSLEARTALLDKMVAHYLRQGFKVVSHSATGAEVTKPEGFPAWLFKSHTHYLTVDEFGRIYDSQR